MCLCHAVLITCNFLNLETVYTESFYCFSYSRACAFPPHTWFFRSFRGAFSVTYMDQVREAACVWGKEHLRCDTIRSQHLAPAPGSTRGWPGQWRALLQRQPFLSPTQQLDPTCCLAQFSRILFGMARYPTQFFCQPLLQPGIITFCSSVRWDMNRCPLEKFWDRCHYPGPFSFFLPWKWSWRLGRQLFRRCFHPKPHFFLCLYGDFGAPDCWELWHSSPRPFLLCAHSRLCSLNSAWSMTIPPSAFHLWESYWNPSSLMTSSCVLFVCVSIIFPSPLCSHLNRVWGAHRHLGCQLQPESQSLTNSLSCQTREHCTL